jgi:hypothetical protein
MVTVLTRASLAAQHEAARYGADDAVDTGTVVWRTNGGVRPAGSASRHSGQPLRSDARQL